VPRGRLKLRILDAGHGELIEYTRADEAGPRPSEYRIARTADPDTLLGILSRTLGTAGTVEKARDLYLVGQTRVHIDRVEGLGDFLELEVVMRSGQSDGEARAVAESILREFGLAESELVPRAYIDLLAG
jgi:predicted adenylyl cyclase CyaB